MKKILIVFGTRPEAIKMAPIIKVLEKRKRLRSIICVTAQHREMLDDVLRIFNIRPHYDLDIMKGSQSPFEVTAKSLVGIRKVLEQEKPHLVLVQGDTTTVFAVSLACFYLKIPIGHIEAGLRTNDKYSPFPEEINRRITSTLADFHFAPTKTARMNLLQEGVNEKKIFVTGNTVIDALFWMLKNIRRPSRKLRIKFPYLDFKKRLILVTAHRRESFGAPLKNICYALKKIAERNTDVEIVYPLHLNPSVQKPVKNILDGIERVYLIKPLDYESFACLMRKSYIILTDSGGIQEEAPSLGKPVLVMRDKTERPEGIKAKWSKLVGTETKKIIKSTERLLNCKKEYASMSKAKNPYGDGKASARILKILEDKL